MIEFIEDNETRLRFVSRPYLKLISYLILLIISLPLFYWVAFVAPATSSLSCQRNNNHIDCLLQEKSLLGFSLRDVEINNIKKLDRYIFGLSDRNHITLVTAPDLPKFKLFGAQKKYKYPSKSINLLTTNSIRFKLIGQRKQLRQFIKTQLPQQSLNLKVQLGWFAIFLIPVLVMPLAAIKWILTFPLRTIYDFDSTSRNLTISVRSILKQEERLYGFDRINRVFIDTKDLDLGGKLTLQFIPEYDYPIEEYIDSEYGEANYQKINGFIEKYR